MTTRERQHKETLLTESLLSGLDLREYAREADVPMLAYLADMLVQCAREAIDDLRAEPSARPCPGGESV